MAIKSYKQAIIKLTGMTEQEYKTQYQKFAAQTRNYNAVAGTNASASREFYYKFRYPQTPSKSLKSIEATPATRQHYKGEQLVTQQERERIQSGVISDWSGAISKSNHVAGLYAQIGKEIDGKLYTVADFNRDAIKWSKELRVQRKANPTVGSY